ncbi:hypothetical protein TGME49_309185 [Toxoplasma gondii ME49]|uniref:Uncharacterized protein n=3 Tax=Toxoplasma gondii TaxID=5811 RepID=A0A125YYZ9_TOXGV|nr:hypothetical protein TGME49_309185 [Toxoplasma gondii ME49]EPT26298.1 hypothetical protein TGME49_309185 [Toxoplasma gondii ME49]ESS34738.1 hypothetical protein TGVEG_309185 [Toxoplasma gondii VEG]KYF47430.1 hypothetical protein TGARI_309185 [Toxoplasma gondii ARI]|eukprot:XP_018635626.1 hypothetical protein TGME49_309185 [Toxoplasma gondii ME49]
MILTAGAKGAPIRLPPTAADCCGALSFTFICSFEVAVVHEIRTVVVSEIMRQTPRARPLFSPDVCWNQHYACGALPAELLTRKALSKDLKRLACLKAVRNAED